MSVQPPDPNRTEGYCDPQDVTDFFDKYPAFLNRDELWDEETGEVVKKADYGGDIDMIEDPEHVGPTNPSRRQVESRIMASSNWIDDYTGHAWRERRVENEYKSLSNSSGGSATYYWRAGTPIKLHKRSIRPFDPDKGDKIEFWQGNEWKDWVADSTKEEGRNGDYWCERSTGQLYVYRRHIFFQRHKELRITYRYGKDMVPQTIRDVCARRTAAHYLESQQYRITVPGNEEAPDASSVAENWREICKQDLKPYKEVRTMGSH